MSDISEERSQLMRVAVVGRTEAACRQLVSSARSRLRAHAPAAPAAQQADVVKDFKRAWEAKDLDALIGLLDPGATAVADGGGRAMGALHPVEGGEHIARHLIGIIDRSPKALAFLERTVDGQPGLVVMQDDAIVSVLAFHVVVDRIERIWTVRNPDILRLWAPNRGGGNGAGGLA